MRTLVLDSTFFPVRVVGWEKAMILFLTGRAEIVDEYSEIMIRSPGKAFNLPKILRLFGRHRVIPQVRFCRFNVFYRDKFKCQYCAKRFSAKDLTFDHLIPQSRGGDTNWKNIVTACHKCNCRKGDKMPEEAHMYPLKIPIAPRWSPQLCLRLKAEDPEEWHNWFPGAIKMVFS